MKTRIIALLIFSFVVFASMVSAEILIGEVGGIYNIGDELKVEITLEPSSSVNDFLTVNINCGGQSIEIYKSTFNLAGGEEQNVNVNIGLSKTVIDNLQGNCILTAKYGTDIANSQGFQISNSIDIDFKLNSGKYKQGDKIKISGSALKQNGKRVEGFIEITIEGLDLDVSRKISDGRFSFNLSLPKNSFAGSHIMSIRAYEKDAEGKITNEGRANEVINLDQVLDKLEISIGSQNVFPGEELKYTVTSYDRAGVKVEDEMSLVIYEPGDFVFLKKIVISGEENSIFTNMNSTPGYWKIEATSEDLSSRKLFYIEENEEAFFSLINNTLLIANIGNVPYTKPVEISIGSESEFIQPDLEIDETKKFKLKAPDGSYLIKTNDGIKEITLGNSLLTGRAIGVGEVKEGVWGILYSPIIWISAISMLVILVIILIIIKRKKNSVKGSNIKEITAGSIVSEGKKEDAAAIALSVRNLGSPHVASRIEQVLMEAKNAKANVYIDGNYRIILFSPTLTKSNENDLVAIETAKKMDKMLNEFNKKFLDKINFGIGVNNGRIISELKGSKFKFTSMDKIITVAKKISNESKGEILISDSLRRRVVGKVNAVKAEGTDYWRVGIVVNRDKQKKFVKEFGKKLK